MSCHGYYIHDFYGLVPVSDLNFIEDTSGNLILNFNLKCFCGAGYSGSYLQQNHKTEQKKPTVDFLFFMFTYLSGFFL